jgi:hypothetical protein
MDGFALGGDDFMIPLFVFASTFRLRWWMRGMGCALAFLGCI